MDEALFPSIHFCVRESPRRTRSKLRPFSPMSFRSSSNFRQKASCRSALTAVGNVAMRSISGRAVATRSAGIAEPPVAAAT